MLLPLVQAMARTEAAVSHHLAAPPLVPRAWCHETVYTAARLGFASVCLRLRLPPPCPRAAVGSLQVPCAVLCLTQPWSVCMQAALAEPRRCYKTIKFQKLFTGTLTHAYQMAPDPVDEGEDQGGSTE